MFVIAYPHGERFGRFSGRTGGRSQEVSTTISDPPLHPTPTVGDKGGPEARSGEGFGAPLGEIVRLLRTPCASEAEGGPLHPEVAKSRNQTLRLTGQVLAATGNLADSSGNTDNSWGEYAPAIRRWEHILGREAPAPTQPIIHSTNRGLSCGLPVLLSSVGAGAGRPRVFSHRRIAGAYGPH